MTPELSPDKFPAPLMPREQATLPLSRPRPKPAKAPKPKQRPVHKRLPAPAANLCPPGYVGFLSCDWADQSHELRFWNVAKGELTPYQIDAKPEALQPFLHSLKDRAGEGKIGVIVENHNGSFINQVRAMTDFVLHPVNPKAAAKYRQALHPSGAKSDPIDTDALLRFGLSHLDLCPALAEETAANRLLGRLSEVRRQLVNDATAVSNKLTAVLKGFFPQAFELVGALDRPLAWAFLERWSSLQEVQKAKPETLKKFYYQHNSRRREKLEERLTIIKTAVPLSNDPVLDTTETYHIKALVAQLRAICQGVAKYEAKLEQSVKEHPDYAIFQSGPDPPSDQPLWERANQMARCPQPAHPDWRRPHHQIQWQRNRRSASPRLPQISAADLDRTSGHLKQRGLSLGERLRCQPPSQRLALPADPASHRLQMGSDPVETLARPEHLRRKSRRHHSRAAQATPSQKRTQTSSHSPKPAL
jgi:hypothetical protein